jgi:hypothetical protein
MRKQLIKGFTMLTMIVALAFVTAVASANGQERKARATIPFEFIVGDKSLPAGAYTVGAATAGGPTLRISNNDSNDGALRLTVPLGEKSDHAKLVFHRYGARYFLAEVWTTDEDGRGVMKSRQERAIQKEMSKIATLKNEPAQRAYEVVEIMAALR